jgi:hypothetical protein
MGGMHGVYVRIRAAINSATGRLVSALVTPEINVGMNHSWRSAIYTIALLEIASAAELAEAYLQEMGSLQQRFFREKNQL